MAAASSRPASRHDPLVADDRERAILDEQERRGRVVERDLEVDAVARPRGRRGRSRRRPGCRRRAGLDDPVGGGEPRRGRRSRPRPRTARSSRPGAGVAAHRGRALGREDEIAARVGAVASAASSSRAADARGPGRRGRTREQREAPDALAHEGERRRRRSRRRRSATHAPPGSVRCRWATRRSARAQRAPRSAARDPSHSAPSADGVGGATSSARSRADLGAAGTARQSISAPMRYPVPSPWPSPSRSSRTRAPRSAARSTRSRAPTYNACPQCHSPRRPHRVCPVCGDLRRARGRRAATRTTTTTTTSVSARRPAVHRRGRRQRGRPRARRGRRGARRAAAHGVRVLLFGPADEIGDVPDGRRGRRRAGVDRQGRRSRARGPRDPRRLDRPGRARRSPRASADALVSGGSTGAALAAGAVQHASARAASTGPRSRCRCPSRARPVILLLDVGANVEVRARAPRAVRATWARRSREAVLGRRAPARRRCCPTARRPTKGTPLVVEAHAQLRDARRRRRPCDFVGNVEGTQITDGRGRRGRHRRLHRQRRAEADGGRLADDAARRSATRRCPRRAAKLGGLLLRPALRGLRDEIDPEAPGGAYLLGLRQLGVVAARALHAPRLRPGDRASPRAASREDVVGRTHAALEAAGALRRAGPSRPRRPASVLGRMTREEVFALIRAHLADELEVDPARDRRGDALQGGPRGRLARPLHARAGARGLLRREDVRRAGGAGSSPSARRSTSCSPTHPSPTGAALTAGARSHDLLDELPEDLARQVFTHASWTERRARLLRAAGVPRRQRARRWRSPRTCTRAWRPSATAPGG